MIFNRGLRKSDLVPMKVVVEMLCISTSTLWRVRKSRIRGIPKPIKLRGQLFWVRADLDKLEDAIFFGFKGRGVFERMRDRARSKVGSSDTSEISKQRFAKQGNKVTCPNPRPRGRVRPRMDGRYATARG